MDAKTQLLPRACLRRSAAFATGCALAITVGCRLPCYDGPSAKNVLASRQLVQQGMRDMERGEWKGAEKHFATAVKQCPADHEAHRLYAETLWKAGRQQEALVEINEALRISGDDEQSLVRHAEMRLARSEFEQALDAARRALDVNPQSADAWAVRGKIWQTSGDLSRAAADFHQSLGREPGRRDALESLAEIYRRQNEPQRALANLRALAETYPVDEVPREVLEQQAQALLALNRPADAAEQLAVACRRGAPVLPLWLAMADCQLQAGQTQAALVTLDQAQAFWPGSPEVAQLAANLNRNPRTLLTSRP